MLVIIPVPGIKAKPSSSTATTSGSAPHGVATLAGTVGEEYSQFYLIGALIPELEFNLQLIHYYDDPQDDTDSYTATSIYAKRRLSENEGGHGGVLARRRYRGLPRPSGAGGAHAGIRVVVRDGNRVV